MWYNELVKNKHIFVWKGKSYTLQQLSDKFDFKKITLYNRLIIKKIPLERALDKSNLRTMSESQKLESLRKRLYSNYKIDKNGCWIWQGNMSGGYGRIGFKKKLIATHRASYMFHNGSINKELDCCHTCDNTSCINPQHLFLGTHTDNMRDKSLKERGRAKLSYEKASQVRKMYDDGIMQKDIANIFSITQSAVSRIIINKNYKVI